MFTMHVHFLMGGSVVGNVCLLGWQDNVAQRVTGFASGCPEAKDGLPVVGVATVDDEDRVPVESVQDRAKQVCRFLNFICFSCTHHSLGISIMEAQSNQRIIGWPEWGLKGGNH